MHALPFRLIETRKPRARFAFSIRRAGDSATGVSRRLAGALALLVTSLLAIPEPIPAAEWRKLSQGQPFSDVGADSVISPNLEWVVFAQDRDVDEARELFSAPINGSAAAVRISGLLPSGSSVSSFEIVANSSRVVYISPEDTTGVFELFSVPIAGGQKVKLNADLPNGGDVRDPFKVTPSGQRVVYVADQETDNVFELYSVPTTGGIPVKLNGPLVSGGNVIGFIVSPLGGRVVYVADQQTDNVPELYSVPITGGIPIKLNGPLVSGGNVIGFIVSPLGDRVVFTADQQTDNVFELYSAPITGGTAVKLNGALASGGSIYEFKIDPTGSRVVYLADQQTLGVRELYSAPIAGGTVVKLNGVMASGGDVRFFSQISPLGDRVAYLADQEVNDVDELYSVPIAGGTAVKLSGSPRRFVYSHAFSPDGAWVVFLRESSLPGFAPVFFRVPAAGPATLTSLGALNPQLANLEWQFDPRGDRLVAITSQSGSPTIRLWSVRVLEPLPLVTELLDESEFPADGNVFSFSVADDGSIVYVADQETDSVFDLYSILPPLFADGFEIGSTVFWSAGEP